jgi:hypothetical protein
VSPFREEPRDFREVLREGALRACDESVFEEVMKGLREALWLQEGGEGTSRGH